MKLHIVVPTIMTNPSQEFDCLKELAITFDLSNLDYTIYFVSNIELNEFNSYVPYNNRIKKSISNLSFSISRAVNSVFENIEFQDDDILGFIQSDTFFGNKKWITEYIDILNDKNLNAGVIGARPHKASNKFFNSIFYKNKFTIVKVLWADGVMLFKGKTFKDTGYFDEQFFGDCESEDFCYRVHDKGYNNYWLSDDTKYFNYENRAVSFDSKARYDRENFKQLVNFSKIYFRTKWKDFEYNHMNKSTMD